MTCPLPDPSKSEHEFTIQDQAPIMFAMVTKQMRVVRVNEALAKFTNRLPSELEGLELGEIIGCRIVRGNDQHCGMNLPCVSCRLRHAVQSAFQRGTTTQRLETNLSIVHGDDPKEVNLLVTSVVDDPANPDHVLLWLEDVTAMRQVERQYLQAQKMEVVGRLTASVIHDLNNLLTVIMGNADLIAFDAGVNARNRELLDVISGAATRAARMSNQLLGFCRQHPQKFQSCNLNELLSENRVLLERLFGKEIQVDYCCAPQLPMIQANPDLLHQAVMNLAINAKDAMPRGGRFQISTHSECARQPDAQTQCDIAEDNFAVLTVSDTGYGMSADTLKRIFEPFFTTKAVGKGTGLGLASVDRIIRQHHGWIDVTSQPGQGSTFKLYFPTANESTKVILAPTTNCGLDRGNETILVIESELETRCWLADTLRCAGYRVLEAANASEGLVIWKKKSDAIGLLVAEANVSDQGNGVELVQKLQAQKPRLGVLYSADCEKDIQLLKEQGVARAGILSKPFNALQLLQSARDCLDRLDPARHQPHNGPVGMRQRMSFQDAPEPSAGKDAKLRC